MLTKTTTSNDSNAVDLHDRRMPLQSAHCQLEQATRLLSTTTAGLGQPRIGSESRPGPHGRCPGEWAAVSRSALDRVVQMQHAVALDHLVGIVEEDGAGMAAEEAHLFAENHRGDIHRDFVDQPGRERLPAEVAGAHANEAVAR